MAKYGGNNTPNQDKYRQEHPEAFEYIDFGGPSLYLWAAVVVIVALIAFVLFAMIVASGALAVSEVVNGL